MTEQTLDATEMEVREDGALPRGWHFAKLEELVLNPKSDIVDGPFGSDMKASEYVVTGIPIIRLQNIDRDQFILKNMRYLTTEKAERLKRHSFQKGDIVITKLGDPLGKACIVPDNLHYGIIVADVVRMRMPEEYLLKKFIVHAINSDFVIKQLDQKVKGTTRPRVNLGHIREIEIPLAPLLEQHRIVAEIEKQFTRLDAGVTTLKRVRAALKRYKAAVLKAACEGRLVQQDPNDEPADELLKRIIVCRGEPLRSPRVRATASRATARVAPTPMDGLPELPSGWGWATLPQLGELARGKSKHRPRNEPKLFGGPYPFIQTGEIKQADGTITTYTETYSEFGLAQSRLWPKRTLCITIAANIAETAILGFDACFPDSVVGFIGDERACDVRYIEYFIRTVREDLERYAPATAQKNINLDTLQNLPIALPPLAEQQRIVAEVERRLSVVQELQATVAANLARAERLRQSILKRAFEGKLVPQDPNDEPASVLLERIKERRGDPRGRPRQVGGKPRPKRMNA